MHGSLHRVTVRDGLSGLILEEIDGMRGVMPQEMVGPAARVARSIDVLAPEEIGLNVHLLDGQFAFLDACGSIDGWD
jgi:hypothetical protein